VETNRAEGGLASCRCGGSKRETYQIARATLSASRKSTTPSGIAHRVLSNLPPVKASCLLAAWLCEETIQLLSPSLDDHHDPVFSWISHAPSPPPSIASCGKRKRPYSKHIANEMSSRDPSPRKRRRLEATEYPSCATKDVENTPRAKSNVAIKPPSPSSFTSSSRTTHSSHSRRSRSPKRKHPLRRMANLSLLPNPVVMKSIDDATATPPNELEEIVLQLRRIGRGLGVISRSEKVGQYVFFLHAKLTGVGCSSFHVLEQIVSPDIHRRPRLRG
jgi:hypothetical protein